MASLHQQSRRFQFHYGVHDGAGYIVVDTADRSTDRRGKVVWKGDSRSEGEAEANRRNREVEV